MKSLGIWMWPDALQADSAESVAARCARLGVTDIFFLTKGLAGTASFRSALAPCPADGDPLRAMLSAAHAEGIRVHAWVTSACDAHYKSLHPESGRCHYVRGRDNDLISLADEGYLAYMTAILQELFRAYDLDGLHLDYIRYNHLLCGWDEADLARYTAAGADLARLRELMDRTFLQGEKNENSCIFDALREGDPSVRALAGVRRADVNRFASSLCAAALSEKKDLTISAALMPEGAYADTAFADLHYGQCYPDMAALCDLLLPMAYSLDYGKDSAWVREVAEGTLKHGARTLVGVQAYGDATESTLRSDLAAISGLPAEGSCLFRYGTDLTNSINLS